MSRINPGLGERLSTALQELRAHEQGQACTDQPVTLLVPKAVASYVLVLLVEALERPAGLDNALDYDDEQRTDEENLFKSRVVSVLAYLLDLLSQSPVRTWPEVAELQTIADLLGGTAEGEWRREVVALGGKHGLTVAHQKSGATVVFETPEGTVSARVLKAETPDEYLDNVDVHLVEEVTDEAEDIESDPSEGGELTGRYAVMVDDPYWGRRIQPAAFTEAPLSETFVMGYELTIQVVKGAAPVENATVSLALEWLTDDDGVVKGWLQPDEFNGLTYSAELETYVESGEVFGRIMTDAEGRAGLFTPGLGWSRLILPKGHGAPYQRVGDRRDDSPETAAETQARGVQRIVALCQGRAKEVSEGSPATIDLAGGTLRITGPPGSSVQVMYYGEGSLLGGGTYELDWLTGQLELSDLRPGEWHVFHFRKIGSYVDTNYGGPRVKATVRAGETTELSLGSLTDYSGSSWERLVGRVYRWGAEPAAGVTIYELRQQLEPPGTRWKAAGVTGADGFFDLTADPNDPDPLDGWAIDDPTWGYFLFPTGTYHDVVLGGRVVSVRQTTLPELGLAPWRKGAYRHENFATVEGGITFRERDGKVGGSFSSEELPDGMGFVSAPLPKTPYTGLTGDDGTLAKLNWEAVRPDGSVVETFQIGDDQNVCEPGLPFYSRRSVGVAFPKTATGGKIVGNVLRRDEHVVRADLPESARVGLEFGRHEWFLEVRHQSSEGVWTCFADIVCPYCGGPAWLDPDRTESPLLKRGYCTQCAAEFGQAQAMDCRGYFESIALPETE